MGDHRADVPGHPVKTQVVGMDAVGGAGLVKLPVEQPFAVSLAVVRYSLWKIGWRFSKVQT